MQISEAVDSPHWYTQASALGASALNRIIKAINEIMTKKADIIFR